MNAGPVEQLSWQISSAPVLTIGDAVGDADYELHRIRGVAQFPDGMIAVVNSGSNEVRFYDPKGKHVRTVGRSGRGPAEFIRPSLVPSQSYDSLVVTEASGRLRIVSRDGSIRYVTQLQRTDLNVGIVGNRLVNIALRPDSSRGAVGRGWSMGDVQLEDPVSGSRTAVASLPWVEVFRDADGGGVVVAPGVETSVVAGNGAIHVAVTGSGTVRTYNADGTLLRVVRLPLEERTPDDSEFQSILDSRVRTFAGAEAARHRKRLEDAGPPARIPLIERLIQDSEGYVWAKRFSPGSDSLQTWLVIDSTGELRGRLSFAAFSVEQIGKDYILGVTRIDEGVEQVVRYLLAR